MRIGKVFMAFVLVVILSSASLAKKESGVYLFGVSSSFSDTVVYFTEIQFLDTVKLDKGGILPDMHNYSGQLENYIQVMQDKSHQTAAIFYSTKRGRLEKERTKLYNRYKKKKNSTVEFLSADDFTYVKANKED